MVSDDFDVYDYLDQMDEADIQEAAADPQWTATTQPQRPMGQRVENLADAQPGDVVFFAVPERCEVCDKPIHRTEEGPWVHNLPHDPFAPPIHAPRPVPKITCTCNPDSRSTHCYFHVSCDDNCGALHSPVTLEETQAALEHWERHSCVGGCSHGC